MAVDNFVQAPGKVVVISAGNDGEKVLHCSGLVTSGASSTISLTVPAYVPTAGTSGGLRAYWNDEEEQLFVFRPLDHYRRFLNSTKIMHMALDHTPESLAKITIDLLRADDIRYDAYIRPLAYKSDEIVGVKLHDLHDELSIVALAYERYLVNDTDAHVTISSWRRVDDNMIPARGKIAGAYANSALIKTDAHYAGFDEALVLTQEGHISEGSAMNIFLVRNGVVITPPITDNILEGITRRSVIELAREELGVPVHPRIWRDVTETCSGPTAVCARAAGAA